MRKIHELLKIILIARAKEENKKEGLCTTAIGLKSDKEISPKETEVIRDYIINHKPLSYFLLNRSGNVYHWDDQDDEARIRYLKRHIFWNKLINR